MSVTPGSYASALLSSPGIEGPRDIPEDNRDESLLWAASGAQYLTGSRESSPLPAPAPLATCAQGAWLALVAQSQGQLDAQFQASHLLGERAAILGLQRQGALSAGGTCRLLDCADGQIALNMPREQDWELVPAWLERPVSCWEGIAEALLEYPSLAAASRARMLGLAAAASRPPSNTSSWFRTARLARPATQPRHQPLVIDLTALWAGPLCTQVLGAMGARVIKVESTARPDGARAGTAQFFDLLNDNKQSVALDLASTTGRRQLRELLCRADIIVEASRPRALRQMGIQADDIVRQGKGRVWLSITGYGRATPMGEWIAYGDDAGVAAGLSWLLRQSIGRNLFCADAIADPLTGLHAALLAWTTWRGGGGMLLDISLRGVLAQCIAAGVVLPSPEHKTVAVLPPRARPAAGSAAALGAHTAEILREFGIRD